MENMKIYLSGGMTGLSMDEQMKWRNQIINALKYGNFEVKKNLSFFSPPEYYNFSEKDYKTEKEVFEFDLYQLRHSDLVVVNFNAPQSIGTAMELMLAKEMHIPVIGLNKDGTELHPWLVECCTRICDNTKELVSHLTEFYLS